MQFKICRNKTLCLDLQKSSKEETMLVVSTVVAACKYLEDAGYEVTVKAKEKPPSANKRKHGGIKCEL